MESDEGRVEPTKLSLLGFILGLLVWILSLPLWMWSMGAALGSFSIIQDSIRVAQFEDLIDSVPNSPISNVIRSDYVKMLEFFQSERRYSAGLVLLCLGVIVVRRLRSVDRPARFTLRDLLWAMTLIGPGLAAYYWAVFVGAQSALVAFSVGIPAGIAVGAGIYLLLRVRPAA